MWLDVDRNLLVEHLLLNSELHFFISKCLSRSDGVVGLGWVDLGAIRLGSDLVQLQLGRHGRLDHVTKLVRIHAFHGVASSLLDAGVSILILLVDNHRNDKRM